MAVICHMQRAYGRELDPVPLVNGFSLILQDKYSVDDVINALFRYMRARGDVPTPADIVEILEPKITFTQYQDARKWQERNNNWSEFTDAGMLIYKYNKQEKENGRASV